MSERGTGTRKQEHEIVIDAPVESVWKAITDAEELTRWFVEAAKVEPGVGGTFRISWGGAEEGASTIEVWEPNRRLRVVLAPFDMGPAKYDGTSPIIDEYTIERRDGKTVLRLVSSGIPDTPEWDGFYNGTDSGWRSFFRTLRHYLEHHAGKPRTSIKIVGKLPATLEDSWARLTGPEGFGFTPVAGEAFAARTGPGDPLHGRVVFVKAPGMLELSIDQFDNAFFAHSMACAGGGQFAYSVLSVYGKSAAEVEAIRARWEPWLTAALGIESIAAVR
jgi:uncharacterized protein YndB with AHSA1/START domain